MVTTSPGARGPSRLDLGIEADGISCAHLADVSKISADRGKRLDLRLVGRRPRSVACAQTDADQPEPRAIDVYTTREPAERGAQVLDLVRGVLVLARRSAAFAEVTMIDGERSKPARGQRTRIDAGDLLLHARHGTCHHYSAMRTRRRRQIEVPDDLLATNVESNPLFHRPRY